MRYWTEDEAREYLPRLRELIGVVQQKLPVRRAKADGHPTAGTDEVAAAMTELEEGGIVLRQLDAGLVDFPARGDDGVEYLLCWRTDEPDLGWWHLPEEGFAGRKPLPRRGAG